MICLHFIVTLSLSRQMANQLELKYAQWYLPVFLSQARVYLTLTYLSFDPKTIFSTKNKICNRNCLTINDVFPVHPNVVVSVGTCLFMVKTKGMEQLMLNGAMVQTTLTTQRHSLTTTLTAHIGIAAVDA